MLRKIARTVLHSIIEAIRIHKRESRTIIVFLPMLLMGAFSGASSAIADGNPLWSRLTGSTNSEYATSVTTDSNGNVYVTGYTNSLILDGQANAGTGNDILLLKYSSSGEKQWTRLAGTTTADTGQSVGVDSSGNVYVAGVTGGSLYSQPYSGGTDIFIIKSDSTGSRVWTRETGTTGADTLRGMAVDSVNNVIYLTGSTDRSLDSQPYVSGKDIFLMKYDLSGNKIWTKETGTASTGMNEEAYGVAVDGSGNVFIAGLTYGWLGDGPNEYAGGYDIFLMKYDAGGNKQWTRQMGTSYNDAAQSVAVDANGNVYVAGITWGDLDGNSNTGPYSTTDVFLAKYDNNGNKLWTKEMGTAGTDSVNSVAVDRLGNAYITGYVSGSFDGRWYAGGTDVIVIKVSSAGLIQWARELGTSTTDRSLGVTLDAGGNVYVVGNSDGDLDGNAHSGIDLFLVKYDSSLSWTRQFGAAEADKGWSVAADGSGHIYLTGTTQGSFDGFTNPSPGTADIFLLNYTSTGDHLWVKQAGTTVVDEGKGVAVDGSGNAYLAGYTATGGWIGDGVPSPAGSDDIFLRKYDGNGNKLWSKQAGSSFSDQAFCTTVSGTSVYIAGTTLGILGDGGQSGNGKDIFLMMNSSITGSMVWSKQIGTLSSDSLTSMATDTAGNVYIAGYTAGWLDDVAGSNGGYNDIYIMKYAANGSRLWSTQTPSAGDDYAHGIAVDADGNAYVAGSTSPAAGGVTDIVLTKYDVNGSLLWSKQTGSAGYEEARGVAISSSGAEIYIAGNTNSSLDGNMNAGNYDMFLMKYDAAGSKQWTKQIGSNGADYAYGITVDDNGDTYITGYVSGSLDRNLYSGTSDIALIKYNTGSDTTDPTGSLLINGGASMTKSASVTLTSTCSDAGSCRQMQFSNDNAAWSSPENYATTRAWDITDPLYGGVVSEGTHTVFARFSDYTGNWSVSYPASITLDTLKPTLGSPAISLEDRTTSSWTITDSWDVDVIVSASDANLSQMILSNDGVFDTEYPEPYGGRIWNLPACDGLKTVWVKFGDSAGNWSDPVSASITLDTTAPATGSISINNGDEYTRSTTASVTASCANAAQMQFSNDNSTWSTPVTYTTGTNLWVLAAGDGAKTVYARFADTAGNWTSYSITDPITLDSEAPIGSLGINGNAPFATGPTVTLDLACSDSPAGCTEVKLSNDGLVWGAPLPFTGPTGTTSYTLGSGASTVWAWGINTYGQLGISSLDQQTAPRQAGIDDEWVSISSGNYHTIAVRADGTLWAWGRNESCQLGLGLSVACDDVTGYRSYPTRVGTRSDWVAVSAGGSHSLAMTEDGRLWAWGSNQYGQLGLSSGMATISIPTAISGSTWIAMAAGTDHSLGIKSDLSLWTWGRNNSGQLGIGNYLNKNAPYSAATGSVWSSVSAGGGFSQAVKPDGSLWSWGFNGAGQLGIGNLTTQTTPQSVATGTTWTSVSAGGEFTLGIKSDGSLWSWGDNQYGQLGIGTGPNKQTPQPVQPGSSWFAIEAGNRHAAGITSDGRLWTWGMNTNGQLGFGDTTQRTLPEEVPGGVLWKTVTAGVHFTTAIPVTGDRKYVYAKYKDAIGNWSQTYSGTIVLDETAPAGTVKINNDAEYTQSITVDLGLTCDDAVSGCAEMCVSKTPSCSAWETFNVVKNSFDLTTSPTTTVYVWFRDRAGKETASPITDTIILDGAGPSVASFSINASGETTTTPIVTLFSSVTDPNGVSMQFSNDNVTWDPVTPGPYNSSRSWTLLNSEGTRTVYARFIDNAGNPSTVQDTIVLDSIVPTGTIVIDSMATYATSSAVTLTLTCSDATSGCNTATGKGEMQFSNSSDGPWSPLVPAAPTFAWNLNNTSYGGTGTDGPKTVYARFRDVAGNLMVSYMTDTIKLDSVPPVGTVTINNALDAFTTSPTVTLNLACADPIPGSSGCSGMEFSNGSTGPWSPLVSFASTTTWDITNGLYSGNSNNGPKAVYARFTDTAGNPTTVTISDGITYDTAIPTGTLTINNDAEFSLSTSVTLTVLSSDTNTVSNMKFSNDGSNWSDPVPYQTAVHVSWTTTTADGPKTVYAQYQDAAGLWSGPTTTIFDTITLDMSAPTGTVIFSGLTTYATTTNVTLALSCSDATSGCSQRRFSNDGTNWSSPSANGPSASWNLTTGEGSKTVYAQFKDTAGNWSTGVINKSIILDTQAPTGSVSINGGAAYTTSADVTLALTCSDAMSPPCFQMQISKDNGSSWSSLASYTTSTVVTLVSVGTNTIKMRYSDSAGNWMTTAGASIIYDNIVPTGSLTINSGASYALSTSVTLTVSASDTNGVTNMKFSNDGATWSSSEPYQTATPKTWPLSSGDGSKQVYVRFQDNAVLVRPDNDDL